MMHIGCLLLVLIVPCCRPQKLLVLVCSQLNYLPPVCNLAPGPDSVVPSASSTRPRYWSPDCKLVTDGCVQGVLTLPILARFVVAVLFNSYHLSPQRWLLCSGG